jgi:hypothetical protein
MKTRQQLQAFILMAWLMPVLPSWAEPLPRDVQRFVDRREGCDHMRRDIPASSEQQRINEVTRELSRLCSGTDKELVQLKRKYAGNSTIMQILNQFEAGIEAAEAPAPKRSLG